MPFAAPGQTILGRRGARRVVGGGALARTYAEFQSHIAGLATSGERSWSGQGFSSSVTNFTTTATAPVGGMTGSSWMSPYSNAISSVARIVQHSLPSPAVYDQQIADGRQIYLDVTPTSTMGPYAALARNGFTSSAGAEASGRTCSRVLYYDAVTGPMQMNPNAGTGPTPYTW